MRDNLTPNSKLSKLVISHSILKVSNNLHSSLHPSKMRQALDRQTGRLISSE